MWYNNRQETFIAGQKVSIRQEVAYHFNTDKARVYRASRECDCMGCSEVIMEGDLHGRMTSKSRTIGELPLCLNCLTLKDGMFGGIAEQPHETELRLRLKAQMSQAVK